MKIWEAKLRLILTDEEQYRLQFAVTPLKSDYEKDDTYYVESCGGFCANRIPMTSQVVRRAGGYLVSLGFEHEPDAAEVKAVQQQLQSQLLDYLAFERQQWLAGYEERLSAFPATQMN